MSVNVDAAERMAHAAPPEKQRFTSALVLELCAEIRRLELASRTRAFQSGIGQEQLRDWLVRHDARIVISATASGFEVDAMVDEAEGPRFTACPPLADLPSAIREAQRMIEMKQFAPELVIGTGRGVTVAADGPMEVLINGVPAVVSKGDKISVRHAFRAACSRCGAEKNADDSAVTWVCQSCGGLVCRACAMIISGSDPPEYHETTLCSPECWEAKGSPAT